MSGSKKWKWPCMFQLCHNCSIPVRQAGNPKHCSLPSCQTVVKDLFGIEAYKSARGRSNEPTSELSHFLLRFCFKQPDETQNTLDRFWREKQVISPNSRIYIDCYLAHQVTVNVTEKP